MGKQDETPPEKDSKSARMSRKHLFALWGTLITVLGTSVVPKIIDVLSDRPSDTEVQDMIAEQTKALTETVNKNIDALDNLGESLHELDKGLAHMKGLDESLREVVRDCCTRRVRDVEARLRPKDVPKPKPEPDPEPTSPIVKSPDYNSASDVVVKIPKPKTHENVKPAVQKKLPEFDPEWIQQKAK